MRSPSPETESSATAKLASYFSNLSPIPAFPEYTGPYKVGTVDVEIPISELESPCPVPEGTSEIETVLFRVFYPAVDQSTEKRITWLPNPQRHHVSAYTRFLGLGSTISELLSFIPRHMYYTTIPVHKNATLLDPNTPNKRWPTMIFSHGLGGSRNSYSYIAGSLASHGLVVFCPEHRDGSSVTTIVRTPTKQQDRHYFTSHAKRVIPYQRISHDVTPEIYEQREHQIRIRAWEMGLIHQAILSMDKGFKGCTNLNTSTPSLAQFTNRLHVNEPGSIIFGGHSFGAATVYQLLKSTYYADTPQIASMEKPVFRPTADSDIRKQITEKTVTMLLDMWCLPILSPNSAPLHDLPLPMFDDKPSASGGTALLAVESEAFFKWKEHLHAKARLLSPDPTAKTVQPELYERPSGIKLTEPNFFYVVNSAHLNQSDFGILFPWLTKKIFDAAQPERALRLNLRAQLQLLRANGVPIARTYAGDLVDGSYIDKLDAAKKGEEQPQVEDGLNDDKAIFERGVDGKEGPVDHWKWIDIIGLGDKGEKETGKSVAEQVEEGEEEMKGELELEPGQGEKPALERTLSATAVA